MEDHGNLVGGSKAETKAGRFEVRAATSPWESLGVFPLSDAAALRGALEGLAGAAKAWGGLAAAERRRRLTRAARAFAGSAPGPVARRLGLDPAELAPHRAPLAVPEPGAPRADPDGVALCAPAWSELYCGTWEAVSVELAQGRGVLVAADPRLPHLAEALAHALLEAGVPGEALALVHGAADPALAAAIGEPAVVSLRASGGARRIAALRRAAEEARCEAHISVRSSESLEVPPLDADADLAALAAEVVERAFGRSRALFGQLAGQVARVFVPERLLSRFTALLLAALEESEPARRPLPLIDDEAVLATKAAWARGLDEGATLIAGGGVPASAAPGSRLVLPTVFTNVELDMQLPHRREPLPVLSLLRSRDAHA